ncbi:hypothetical protein E4656_13780 [Natronospirillum operosum]|uniref:Phage tail tape measure protein n=1 Tax=Natronospirillum operosum TaxID=2759953 RepID=A0A4Z0WD67_9GAMM|nr:hypothetical protein [Natronospirillum operosum]TGG92534.1 hypothetical protein E4656_13780 [Natronospirillum operosum]
MALSVLLRVRDQFSGPLRNIQTRLGAFQRQAQVMGRRMGFDRLTGSLALAGRASGELYRATGRLARRLAFVGALGAASLAGIAFTTASSGDEMAKFSDQVGMSADQLQRWQYAAERNGVSNFNSSLESFVRRLGDARNGQGELFSRLQDTQPQLLRQLMATNDTSEALRIYMRALEGTDDALERNQLAAAAFSRSGMDMSRLVRDGGEALDGLMDQAHRFGHFFSGEGLAASEAFADGLTNMRSSLFGVRNIVGSALLPVFTELMGQLTELVIEHQPAIQAWAEGFAADLPGHIEMLKGEVLSLVDTLTPLVMKGMELVEQFGVVNSVVLGLGAVLAGPVALPLSMFVLSLLNVGFAVTNIGVKLIGLAVREIPMIIGALKMLGMAIIANPIGALITAIAIGAALIIANWETVGPWFKEMWERFAGYVSGAWGQLVEFLGWDPLAVLRQTWGAMVDYVSDVTGAVVRLVSGDWSALIDLFKLSPLGMVMEAFGEVTDWLADIDWSGHGRALIATLVQGIKDMASGPADALRGVLSSARDLLPFSDAKTGPFSSLTASGQAIPNTLATGMARGQDGFLSAFRDLAGLGLDAFSRDSGADTVTLPEPLLGRGGQAAASGGITVHRVDFRPNITVRVGNDAQARDVADELEAMLERLGRRDMWSSIKTVGDL